MFDLDSGNESLRMQPKENFIDGVLLEKFEYEKGDEGKDGYINVQFRKGAEVHSERIYAPKPLDPQFASDETKVKNKGKEMEIFVTKVKHIANIVSVQELPEKLGKANSLKELVDLLRNLMGPNFSNVPFTLKLTYNQNYKDKKYYPGLPAYPPFMSSEAKPRSLSWKKDEYFKNPDAGTGVGSADAPKEKPKMDL